MTTLQLLIVIAGVLHFGILIASSLVPQVLDWRGELRRVSPMTRHLVWTHGAFIVITIIGFGVIALTQAASLASGEALARALCGFIAIFWGARFLLQFVLFDPTPLLTKWWLKAGYHGLTLVFAFFAAVFGWAALR